MNLQGVMYLFIILALVTTGIIIPWYIDGVAANAQTTSAISNLDVPQFSLYHVPWYLGGSFTAMVTAPIALIDFGVGYTGYMQTVLSVGAPGFDGWVMIIWYLVLGLLSATTMYIIYTIIAARAS